MLTRRDFLRNALAGLALAALKPDLAWAGNSPQPILVAVHLTGGNDALNTLVPHNHPAYKQARPHLALPTKRLLTINHEMAFHPALASLAGRYERGQVMLMPGIGRPDHDRSHFRSSDLWHCAGHPDGHGWMADLGARLDSRPVSLGDTVSRAVTCPGHAPIGIIGQRLPEFPGSPELRNAWTNMMAQWQGQEQSARQLRSSSKLVEEMTGRLSKRMDNVALKTSFAGDDFGKRFDTTARMIAVDFPSRLYHISVGHFDTHSDQLDGHARELGGLDHALEAFLSNLGSLGRPVVVTVYSEFGRRIEENLSGGTDHGAGGLAWLVGETVNGGMVGPGYGLDSPDDGDVKPTLDYRQLYRTAIGATFDQSLAENLFPRA